MKRNYNPSLKLIIVFLSMIFVSTALFAQGKQLARNKITNNYILRQLVNERGINNKEVQMLIVNFPPGSSSRAHRHTCPTFGYILEGQIKSVFEGKIHLYKKGDSFYEKPFGLHAMTMNPDQSKPAKLLVFFIDEKDKPNTESIK